MLLRSLIASVIVLAAAPALEVNRASQAELEGIGLNASQAAQIVRYRQETGDFRQAEELLAVPQISRAVFDRIRPRVTVEAAWVAPPAPIALPAATDGVGLESARAEWQNLYGAIVYSVSGTVHNGGPRPLRAVRVRLELLDGAGQTVATTEGYNLAAEGLETAPDAPVSPIAPGATDPLRLSLDKSEIGRPFRSVRLTVVRIE